jgi:hypothetical protein
MTRSNRLRAPSARREPRRQDTPLPIDPAIKRFPDGCYAVVRDRRRGPCGHDKPTARARYRLSGLIAAAQTDSPCCEENRVAR